VFFAAKNEFRNSFKNVTVYSGNIFVTFPNFTILKLSLMVW